MLGRLISQVSAYQFFQLCRFSGMFAIGIFLAKSGVSLEDIGNYEVVILIVTAAVFFWQSGLLNGYLSIYNEKNEYDQKAVTATTFIFLLIFSLFASAALHLLKTPLLSLNGATHAHHIYLLALLYLLFNTPSAITEHIMLLTNNKKGLVSYGLLLATATIVLCGLPLLIYGSVTYLFVGLTVLAGLKFLMSLFYLFKYGSFQFSFKLAKEIFTFSLPLILTFLLAGSASYIDGFLVAHFFNETQLAIFRYGAREIPLSLILASALSSAMLPMLSTNFINGLQQIKERSKRLIHLLFPISIIAMILSPALFPIVFSNEFAYSAIIFNIYLLLIASRLLFPQTILISQKKSHVVMLIALIEIVVNVSLSLFFMQFWGLLGIAIATVVAYAIDKILLMLYAAIQLKITPAKYVSWQPLLLYSMLLAAAFAISHIYLQ